MRIVLFYISLLFYLILYAFILVLCPLAVIIFLENLQDLMEWFCVGDVLGLYWSDHAFRCYESYLQAIKDVGCIHYLIVYFKAIFVLNNWVFIILIIFIFIMPLSPLIKICQFSPKHKFSLKISLYLKTPLNKFTY